jgi:hypothetical protein
MRKYRRQLWWGGDGSGTVVRANFPFDQLCCVVITAGTFVRPEDHKNLEFDRQQGKSYSLRIR